MNDKKKISLKWNRTFDDAGISPHLTQAYLKYVDSLIDNDVPIIFEFEHLSKLLGRTSSYLASAINSQNSHYRSFKMPKRRKGYREISAPYPALLECQQWINSNILSKIRVHSSAHGFLPRKSIITNASSHLGQRCLLKVDLKDFFPSIKIPRVIRIFSRLGYTTNVSLYLSKLCTLNDCLPQGAATSPAISNIISFGLDTRLSALAKSYDLNYTRYADDLAFSGYYIPHNIINVISSIIEDYGFLLNSSKTSLAIGKKQKIITGISVSGEQVRVPRMYKRKLRQEMHYIKKYGLASHSSKRKIRDPNYLDSLYGKMQFWLSVEPENRFALESAAIIRDQLDSRFHAI